MGKIIKFLLMVMLSLFVLGMVLGLIEQFGGILLAAAGIFVVLCVIGSLSSNGSSQSNSEPVKKAEADEIDKLHVDMED